MLRRRFQQPIESTESLRFDSFKDIACVVCDERVYIGFENGPVFIIHPDDKVTSICPHLCRLKSMTITEEHLWTLSYDNIVDIWCKKKGIHFKRIYAKYGVDYIFYWQRSVIHNRSLQTNNRWCYFGTESWIFDEQVEGDLDFSIHAVVDWNGSLCLGLSSGVILIMGTLGIIDDVFDLVPHTDTYVTISAMTTVNEFLLVYFKSGKIFEVHPTGGTRLLWQTEVVELAPIFCHFDGSLYATPSGKDVNGFIYPEICNKTTLTIPATSAKPFVFEHRRGLFLLNGDHFRPLYNDNTYSIHRLSKFSTWSPETHSTFPKEKRECIKALFTLNYTEGNLITLLPLELIYFLILYVSCSDLLLNFKNSLSEYSDIEQNEERRIKRRKKNHWAGKESV